MSSANQCTCGVGNTGGWPLSSHAPACALRKNNREQPSSKPNNFVDEEDVLNFLGELLADYVDREQLGKADLIGDAIKLITAHEPRVVPSKFDLAFEIMRLLEAEEMDSMQSCHFGYVLRVEREGASQPPSAAYSESRIRALIKSLNPHSDTFVGGTIDGQIAHVRIWLGVTSMKSECHCGKPNGKHANWCREAGKPVPDTVSDAPSDARHTLDCDLVKHPNCTRCSCGAHETSAALGYMDMYAKPGTRVIFTGQNGWSSEPALYQSMGLVVGSEYTVESTDVDSSSTAVYLKEFPGKRFNHVCFRTAVSEGAVR